MAARLTDPRRVEPARTMAEPEVLAGWLDYHRMTLLLKCEGLSDAQRKARPVPSSLLSLHGLVRHMAEVERNWFERGLLDRPDAPFIWHRPGVRDDELAPLDDADWASDVAAWRAECERSRAAAAGKELDYAGRCDGEPLSLRWIYTHMMHRQETSYVPQPPLVERLRRRDPEQVGGFVLIGRLGSGAMGQVYPGRSAAGRLVAVKTIKAELAEESDFRNRFGQEVAAARRVSGVFTAAVVAADSEADVPWLATV